MQITVTTEVKLDGIWYTLHDRTTAEAVESLEAAHAKGKQMVNAKRTKVGPGLIFHNNVPYRYVINITSEEM